MFEKNIQNILSVDDIQTNNIIIYNFLKQDGVKIMMANSGQEALELIDENHFCLFILDVRMSYMDGYELAERIRTIEKHILTPIIFITGIYIDTPSMFKGYRSGAIDYLIKPINKEILNQKVKFFLDLDKQKQIIIEQRDKLIESQRRFYDITRSIGGMIWEVDNSVKYTYISERTTEVMGYESSEILGKTPFDLMTKENALKIKSQFEKIKSKGSPIKDFVNWKLTKSGESICILTNGVPIFDNKNELIGYRGVDIDITSRIRAEEKIRIQAKQLQNINDSIIFTDLEGIIQFVNEGTNYTFGYKPENLIGKTLSLLFPEQYKDLSTTELFIVIDLQPYQSVWQGENKKGELLWLNVKINLMRDPDGKPEGYVIVSNDFSFRKKAENEIIRSLITGEDNERKRIASDLHDGLGQLLTASSLNFNSIRKEIKDLSKTKQIEYNSGLDLLNKSIEELRNIAFNLMPKAIEHFGMISAITSLINSVNKKSDFEISISSNMGDERLDNQLEINMYRITQELLNNAMKHSKAKNLSFQYVINDNELIFIYEDNGIGFNYELKKIKGEGLNNIKNRVASMSGFISINSKIGKGTTISIEIKL